MESILQIVMSWQFILTALIVFLVGGIFSGLGGWKGLGYYLWATGSSPVRKFLVFMEAVKVLFLFVIGFGLGWVPSYPRPPQLDDTSDLAVALIYGIAGLFSMTIVKFAKESLEARGISIDVDLSPREQKKGRRLAEEVEEANLAKKLGGLTD